VSETHYMTQIASPDLIHTPFGFDSTAADVIAGISLDNKHAIVTGASSGIGVETARALANAGAEVTLAVRDPQAGDRTASDISATTGRAVHVERLDLARDGVYTHRGGGEPRASRESPRVVALVRAGATFRRRRPRRATDTAASAGALAHDVRRAGTVTIALGARGNP
jgi:hypothetical protein